MNIFIANKRKVKNCQKLCKTIVRVYQLETFWLHMTDNQIQTGLNKQAKKSGGRKGHRKNLSVHVIGKFQSMLVSGEA